MSDIDNTCEKCGDPYDLRNGEEPTAYCDHCAHLMVDALRAKLSAAEARIGRLLRFVVDEARSACSPEPEELLVAAGLATWEKYDPELHGEIEYDPEPGDRVWVLTDESMRLMDLTPPTAEGASDGA